MVICQVHELLVQQSLPAFHTCILHASLHALHALPWPVLGANKGVSSVMQC